jgi:hypothetical protein
MSNIKGPAPYKGPTPQTPQDPLGFLSPISAPKLLCKMQKYKCCPPSCVVYQRVDGACENRRQGLPRDKRVAGEKRDVRPGLLWTSKHEMGTACNVEACSTLNMIELHSI